MPAVKTKKKNTVTRRKPRNSTMRNPSEWLVEALCGTKGYAGVEVNEHSALSITAVFACVRAIAEDVAKVPLLLKRVEAGDKKTDAVDHPLYNLLRQAPNNEMTSLTFRRTVTAAALLWGNGYAEIQRTGSGSVFSLSPIHPSRVKVVRDKAGVLGYEVRNDEGGFDDIPAYNMLHLPGLGAGVVGYSMLKLGKEAIGCAIAAERFAATFFGNGSRLSGVLQHPQTLGVVAAKTLRDSWTEMHSGTENSHKVAILEEGMTFNPNSVAPEEAQMLETRIMGVQEACRLFRVPPHKVFEMTRSTFGNIEHQSLEYVGDALYTWFALWDQEIKRKLISPREKDLYAEHSYQNLIRGDMASRSTRQRELFNIGAINQNEIRRENGLNPIGPDGDVYYVNASMVPIQFAKLGPQKPEPAPEPDTDPDEPPDDVIAAKTRATQKLAAITPRHCDLLTEAFSRVLTIETDRVRAATKKNGFKEWSDKFYAGHVDHVHAKIGGVIDAFADAAWAILSDETMPEATKQAVFGATRAIATRHIEKSQAEMREPATVNEWATTRAKSQAADEMTKMTDLLSTLAGVQQ